MQKEWYVVNTYSGHENKVKEKLLMRASSMGMEDFIFRVIVPEQKVLKEKENKKTGQKESIEKTEKMFPGYILVEMVMSDEAWFIVRNTPGVTGFIGSSGKGAKPFPLTPMEVDRILGNMGISRLEVGNDLNEGDSVKVVSGPFATMIGKVKTLDVANQKVEVLLDLFGQETTVGLSFTEIEKI